MTCPLPRLLPMPLPIPLLPRKQGFLNHFQESPRESVENHWTRKLINAGDSQVILKWSKNHPENHYLKIAIL